MRIHPHLALCAVLAAGLATALAAVGPAQAGSAVPRAVTSDLLSSVAVASGSDAWAVGDSSSTGWSQTLIEHWNGKAWKIIASPDPGGSSLNNVLYAVAVASPASAWAAGYYFDGDADQPLIERWNSKGWQPQLIQDPPDLTLGTLYGAAAAPSGRAWVVGFYVTGNSTLTLIERWNGTSWRVVPSPNR